MTALLLAAALAGAPASPPAAEPTDAQVVALDTSLWQAAKDRKMDAFRALLAKDYVAIYGKGRLTADQDIEGTQKMNIRGFKFEQSVVRVIDPETALHTYITNLDAKVGEKDVSGPLWSMSVWHRFGEKWLLVVHSETKAPPPPQPQPQK